MKKLEIKEVDNSSFAVLVDVIKSIQSLDHENAQSTYSNKVHKNNDNYLLYCNDEVCGFGALIYSKDNVADFWISLFPEYRRNYIAYRFSIALLKLAIDKGITVLRSEVYLNNYHSIRLHEKITKNKILSSDDAVTFYISSEEFKERFKL